MSFPCIPGEDTGFIDWLMRTTKGPWVSPESVAWSFSIPDSGAQWGQGDATVAI
jgi:hypothetical protein